MRTLRTAAEIAAIKISPVRAEALFLNQEEVRLVPVYRDPVHDFGLFQYNPDDLKYIEPVALKLNPEGARVGVNVRIVGNDAGAQAAFTFDVEDIPV